MQPNPHRPPKVGGSAAALNPGPALHSAIQTARRDSAARRDGGEEDGAAARVGLVRPANEGQQVLGTCSPVDTVTYCILQARLARIRNKRITAPEKDAVDDCIAAVRQLLGGGL